MKTALKTKKKKKDDLKTIIWRRLQKNKKIRQPQKNERWRRSKKIEDDQIKL